MSKSHHSDESLRPLCQDEGQIGETLRSANATLVLAADQPGAFRRLQESITRPKSRLRLVSALALSPALLAAWFLFQGASGDAPPQVSHQQVNQSAIVTAGRATLPDGSSLVVTDGSKAHWEMNNDGVRIALERGTVRCAVAKQIGPRRFVVETPEYAFLALGTEFDVTLTPQSSQLEVLSGTVEVRRGSEQLAVVHAGQAWSSADRALPSSTETITPDPQPDPQKEAGELAMPSTDPSRQTKDNQREPLDTVQNAAREDCSALVKQQKVKQAALCYEKQASSAGLQAEFALFELARLRLSALGDAQGAVRALEQYQARFPTGSLNSQVQLALAKALAAAKRPQAAAAALAPLIAQGGSKAVELRLLRADLYREQGDCARALTDYDTVIASGAFVSEARARRALCSIAPPEETEAPEPTQ